MLKSIVKSAVTVLMSAALCLSLAACGGPAEPEEQPPAAEKQPLLLAAVDSERILSEIVAEYNSSGPERPVELISFDYTNQLIDAIKGGLEADMYFSGYESGYDGGWALTLWDKSIDLTNYVGGSLAGNLASALTYEGELRYAPYDFEIDTLGWTLGPLPGSMAEAAALSKGAGETLFPAVWSRDSLVSDWLFPFLSESGSAEREEIMESVYSHVYDENPAVKSAYVPVFVTNCVNFGLDGFNLNSLGLPGSRTAGVYSPCHVFGILERCEDPDAAWDFLSLLLSGKYQAETPALPASADAIANRISRYEDFSTDGGAAGIALRALVENTTAAQGANLRRSSEEWYIEYVNSPERHTELGI